jgi:preprotein translocase SecE subunit
VARNRQKASERKAARRDTDGQPDERSQPQRANVPNDWEHGSGEIDQAEAAIVAGAEGQVSEESDADLEREALAAVPGTRSAPVRATATPPGAATGKGIGRFGAFLRACWAELQRVQWPDRRQVGQATAVVIGFVIIAGAYLGLADQVAQKIVDFIL